jgi:hypothetical protein
MVRVQVFVILFLILSLHSFAATETMPAGSYIINMGVDPQTIGNGYSVVLLTVVAPSSFPELRLLRLFKQELITGRHRA